MDYPLTISDRGTRMAARGRALGKTLGQMGINQKLQTGLRGYIPIAALGQAAYDWGQYQGSQMDQEMQDPNSALSQQASNIRTAVANGFVPLDDGNFLNLNTNEISSFDQLKNFLPQEQKLSPQESSVSQFVDNRNGETYPTFYGSKEMTPNEVSTRMSAASLNDVPEHTVNTPEPVNTTNTLKTNTSTQPRTVGSSGSQRPKSEGKPQINNSLSGLNALIPLLALGGLGYYMARR